MFDSLTDFVSGTPWTYGIVFGVSALDSFFPVVPSETIVITAGALAAHGSLLIWAVVPAAALGAFAGDQITYGLGHWVGDPVAARLFRGEKGEERLERAERAVRRHGATFVIVGRFVPGGRTASCFACGTLEFSYRRFVAADAIAAAFWGLYAGLIGYLGGTAFAHSLWKSLALAFGVAIVFAALLEAYRRVQEHRGRDILNQPLDD